MVPVSYVSRPNLFVLVALCFLGPDLMGQCFREEQKLNASDGDVGTQFGVHISIEGTRAAVGANQHNKLGPAAGSVYVLEWNGGEWIETHQVLASDGHPGQQFGRHVSLDGDWMAGSAVEAAVYLFEFDGVGWQERAQLVGSGTGPNDDRYVVELCGSTLLIGSPTESVGGVTSGTVYVFEFDGVNWNEVQQLVASDLVHNDYFGGEVSLEDDVFVATNMKVVSLGNVVREYHSAVLTEPRERSEEHTAFEVLRFVDDHECIVQATAANMSER